MPTITEDGAEHSPWGASGYYRWGNCAGSINLIRRLGLESQPAGEAAKLGTAAHKVLSTCLEDGLEPWMMLEHEIQVENSTYPVDEEMVDAVSVAYNYIMELVSRGEVKAKYVERGLQHSIMAVLFGTTDFAVLIETDSGLVLHVVDYKHGIFIVVEPTSPQLKYYGAMLIDSLLADGLIQSLNDIDRVVLTVIQPRASHKAGPIRHATFDPLSLVTWFENDVFDAVARTEDEAAPLTVGDWCHKTFCPVMEKGACPAVNAAVHAVDISIEPEEMTAEQCGEFLRKWPLIKKHAEKVEKIAFALANKGEYIPDKKLVNKMADRVFKEGAEEAITNVLGDKAYEPRKFKSPAQIEKVPGGKELVARWAFKPTTGLTLADESDSREAVRPLMDRLADRLNADEDE